VAEYDAAMAKFMEEIQKAEGEEEQRKLYDELYPKPEAFAGRFLAVAKEEPESPVAVDALVWVATRAQWSPEAMEALEILKRDHIEDAKVAGICSTLAWSLSTEAETLLRAILEDNPDRDAKAMACLSLAQLLARAAEQGAQLAESPGDAEAEGLPAPYLEWFRRREPEADRAEAEKLFERAASEFGEVEMYGRTVGSLAGGALFEMRHLAIGKVAPEIEGEDVEGVAMKLSDYRGKVVVLDFWGDW
jgi:hypothetical protein